MKDEMSLGDKAKELARVVGESIVDPMNAIATDEEVAKRRAICEACPSGKRRRRRCIVCTCNIYVKTVAAKAACPLGHWQAILPILKNPI